MAFKVRMFKEVPDYETLHVAKIVHYPLEPRDYKPYAQARICFSSQALHLQLLSFEAQPLDQSALKAVLCFPGVDTPLEFTLFANQDFSAFCHQDSHALALTCKTHFFTGEDLQGVFWGANIQLPLQDLRALFPAFQVASGAEFRGNFYKICDAPKRPHYGCFFPADFSRPLFADENLEDFVVIDY